jgi:hypothetical protein
VKRRAITGAEQDVVTGWRHRLTFTQRAGVTSGIKRQIRRRERREGRREAREQV